GVFAVPPDVSHQRRTDSAAAASVAAAAVVPLVKPLPLRHRVSVILIGVSHRLAAATRLSGRFDQFGAGVHGSRFEEGSFASLTSRTEGQKATEEEKTCQAGSTMEGRTHRACLPCVWLAADLSPRWRSRRPPFRPA